MDKTTKVQKDEKPKVSKIEDEIENCGNDMCICDPKQVKKLYNVGNTFSFCLDCCNAMARKVARDGI